MALTIKTKIATGIGVLFSLLAIISFVSLLAINLLSSRTESILTANYQSMRYANQMMHALDDPRRGATSFREFETALRAQEENITERGELQATARLRTLFGLLKQQPGDSSLAQDINNELYAISQLNQHALEGKNEIALKTAGNARLWLSVLATLVLIVGLSLAYNLPGVVAAPVKKLTDGIREIAAGNYKTAIELNQQNDEFGQMAQAFNQMAARLYEWENSSMARLLFEKGRVESIINQMEDAVLGTDAEGRILFINRAATVLYNLKSDDVVGKPVSGVAEQNDLLRTILEDQARSPLKIVVDGKEQFFALTRKAVAVEEKPLGEIYTLKNVTHFKELDLSKTNLLATISHELKTPISSIKLAARLLRDERVGALNGEQQEMITGIADDAERMLHLTSELLNLTQIETGNIQLRFMHLSPVRLAAEAVETLSVIAQEKGVEITNSLSLDLPLVIADHDKTVLVLVNLLSNAVRFTLPGDKVAVKATQEALHLRFVVADRGPGIDIRHQARLFDRYYKVPGVDAGTGLGLAIAKEFVEAQGGTIGVESKPGEGSEFWFTVPVAA